MQAKRAMMETTEIPMDVTDPADLRPAGDARLLDLHVYQFAAMVVKLAGKLAMTETPPLAMVAALPVQLNSVGAVPVVHVPPFAETVCSGVVRRATMETPSTTMDAALLVGLSQGGLAQLWDSLALVFAAISSSKQGKTAMTETLDLVMDATALASPSQDGDAEILAYLVHQHAEMEC